MKRGTCNIPTSVSLWVCKQLHAPLRNWTHKTLSTQKGVQCRDLTFEKRNLMKIGPLSEALGCLVFEDSPSYKLLDVAKDHSQTILMVSQSIMIPVDICWHADLPTSFTVSPKRARKWFGPTNWQMPTVMSSKNRSSQRTLQHNPQLSTGALLKRQVYVAWVMACTFLGSPATPENGFTKSGNPTQLLRRSKQLDN